MKWTPPIFKTWWSHASVAIILFQYRIIDIKVGLAVQNTEACVRGDQEHARVNMFTCKCKHVHTKKTPKRVKISSINVMEWLRQLAEASKQSDTSVFQTLKVKGNYISRENKQRKT